MERLQSHQEKSPRQSAREMISTSSSREEAAAEMNKILDGEYADFEGLPRAERVKILHAFVVTLGEAMGDTSEPKFNDNRFLAEAFALRLAVEDKALKLGFEDSSLVTLH